MGGLFALSAWLPEGIEPVGVIIVGRPLARLLHDGATCEVLRCATVEGAPRNTPSFLYGAAKRAAQALGYLRCVTSTLASESGDTLRAVGAVELRRDAPASWDRAARPRGEGVAARRLEAKVRWSLFDLRGAR
jgi:hypothetical protein